MMKRSENQGGSGSGSGAPRILVVCRGNVRRSPAAAALLRAGGLDDFTVLSAGTEALVGDGMDLAMAAELRSRGIALPAHRARLLTPREIENADLIIALERVHRSAVVRMVPASVRRTFTLREVATLVAQMGPESVTGRSATDRLNSMLEHLPAQRVVRERRNPAADDLADLRRPTPRATRALASDLERAVRPLIEALAAPAATTTASAAVTAASAEQGPAQPASQARSSVHHLRRAAANAKVQQAKSAR